MDIDRSPLWDRSALYVYDDDPVGASFAVEALNDTYVRLTVEGENGERASVLVRPAALDEAAKAAHWPD